VALQIYKSGQGRYVRAPTAVGVAIVIAVVAYYIGVLLERHIAKDALKVYLVYGIPALVAAGMLAASAWFLNRPSFVDFLIATESEMKKVSWSGRPELIGSTVVVIVTVVLLAIVIWFFDTIYIFGLTRGLGLW